MESKQVFMFGCWGDYNNREGRPMESVLRSIPTQHSHLILAGDNYYIQKIKDKVKKGGAKPPTKMFDETMIRRILSRLPDIDIDIVAGNHEMDNISMLNNPDNCAVFKSELGIIHELNARRIHPILPRVSKVGSIPLNPAPLCSVMNDDCYVFIDSSMFEYNQDEQFQCYDEIFENDRGDIPPKPFYIEKQLRDILTSYESVTYRGRVFFVAHHPMCIFRSKKDKAETNVNADLIRFVSRLMDRIAGTTYHYLCADFHLYQHQHATIAGKDIDVHIVGTGGTELDAAFKSDMNMDWLQSSLNTLEEEYQSGATVTNQDGTLTVDVPALGFTATTRDTDSIESYGYLDVTTLRFVPVHIPGSGGKRTQRKKRIQKRSLKYRRSKRA